MKFTKSGKPDKRTTEYKEWREKTEQNERAFNNIMELFWTNNFQCNVVWCSPEFKKEISQFGAELAPIIRKKLKRSIDIYNGDFGMTKIFDSTKVKWKQLKPKKIIAFIEE